ncbi:hypothetical protein L9G15_15880 [Shewanella sp. A3A]|nr:hypothetical protein [Shewanella ferrihydritica]
MRVIDTEHWAWFLFEHDGALLLDACCSMSAVTYNYMIRLNDAERAQYEREGRSYLSQLAHAIHYSVPIAKNTQSIYQGRNVQQEYAELATAAVKAWRSQQP